MFIWKLEFTLFILWKLIVWPLLSLGLPFLLIYQCITKKLNIYIYIRDNDWIFIWILEFIKSINQVNLCKDNWYKEKNNIQLKKKIMELLISQDTHLVTRSKWLICSFIRNIICIYYHDNVTLFSSTLIIISIIKSINQNNYNHTYIW